MEEDNAFKNITERVEKLEKEKLKLVQTLSSSPIELSRYRNERNIMFYPICSTSKGKRLKPIEYWSDDNKYFIKVTADHTYGMVKATDLDVLRYAISKAGEVKWKTGIFPQSVEFSAYELLKELKKPTSSKQYQWLRGALARLSSTTYKTNIWEGKSTVFFHLAECSYEDESGKLEKIEVTFNSRLIDSVANNKSLLVVDDEVIGETKSQIRKRLLELVRVAMGHKSSWEVGFEKLKKLLAAEDVSDKKFKETLSTRIETPWNVSIDGYEKVIFSNK